MDDQAIRAALERHWSDITDQDVVHETIYFGDPWEPPAWRAPWVELVERVARPIGQETTDMP
jgi:hypothetical protein